MQAFPCGLKLKCWRTSTPSPPGCPAPSSRFQPRMKSSSESGCVLSLETAECPEPLCPWRALPAHGATSRVASEDITPPSSLIRAHASDQVPPGRLGGPSYAGSLQVVASPCWGMGPSRHYLCNPCVGAWTHTPPRLSSALAHSFLESTGLTPRKMRSAREIVPAMQRQQGAVFRGCSHSFIFRLLRSLGPQIASTAASSCWAAGPFTPRIARVVTHSGMWHRYVSDLGN